LVKSYTAYVHNPNKNASREDFGRWTKYAKATYTRRPGNQRIFSSDPCIDSIIALEVLEPSANQGKSTTIISSIVII
jgi:hypothetical protein